MCAAIEDTDVNCLCRLNWYDPHRSSRSFSTLRRHHKQHFQGVYSYILHLKCNFEKTLAAWNKNTARTTTTTLADRDCTTIVNNYDDDTLPALRTCDIRPRSWLAADGKRLPHGPREATAFNAPFVSMQLLPFDQCLSIEENLTSLSLSLSKKKKKKQLQWRAGAVVFFLCFFFGGGLRFFSETSLLEVVQGSVGNIHSGLPWVKINLYIMPLSTHTGEPTWKEYL